MTMIADSQAVGLSRYLQFTRDEWSHLRGDTPLTLSEEDLVALHGVNEKVSLILVGVPLSSPVAGLNVTHAGTLEMVYVPLATEPIEYEKALS